MSAIARFNAIVQSGKPTTEAEAQALFDSFPAASLNDVLHTTWQGQGFHTGHPLDGGLEAQRWWGKYYGDANTAYPLLVLAPGEQSLFTADPTKMSPTVWAKGADVDIQSNWKKYWRAGPTASIRMVEVRGRSLASMVYDDLPVIDSFVKVDDNTLFGVMEWLELKPKFYFILRRNNNPLPVVNPTNRFPTACKL